MAWLFLFFAGLCEMAWPLGFKYTDGFRGHYPVVAATFVVMLASFGLMSMATARGIPVGTAYAVWTGMGTAGTTALGILLFHDPRDAVRLACLSLILVGIVGVKLTERPVGKPVPAADKLSIAAPA